ARAAGQRGQAGWRTQAAHRRGRNAIRARRGAGGGGAPQPRGSSSSRRRPASSCCRGSLQGFPSAGLSRPPLRATAVPFRLPPTPKRRTPNGHRPSSLRPSTPRAEAAAKRSPLPPCARPPRPAVSARPAGWVRRRARPASMTCGTATLHKEREPWVGRENVLAGVGSRGVCCAARPERLAMTRGNQRELARQKNLKKTQETLKGKRKEDSLSASQRKQRDSEIMQQKQRAANERKSLQAGAK
ncbi:vinculin-like, partial [Numida meleagris]